MTDVVFPSAAAAVVMAQNANGPGGWNRAAINPMVRGVCIMTTAYWETLGFAQVPLHKDKATTVLTLNLPHPGKFVIWGKVVIKNDSTRIEGCGVFLSARSDLIPLDSAFVTLPASVATIDITAGISISLQAVLDISRVLRIGKRV